MDVVLKANESEQTLLRYMRWDSQIPADKTLQYDYYNPTMAFQVHSAADLQSLTGACNELQHPGQRLSLAALWRDFPQSSGVLLEAAVYLFFLKSQRVPNGSSGSCLWSARKISPSMSLTSTKYTLIPPPRQEPAVTQIIYNPPDPRASSLHRYFRH
ncbi:uncharacterized protein V6R79_014654 [Siganus canaliculatus]